MRDAKILICDIKVALEAHPPWYMDRGPASAPHRLLNQSLDMMRRLLDEIEELQKENLHLEGKIDSLMDEVDVLQDEIYSVKD